MGHWNYRITRERLEGGEHMFALREVYYDDNGEPDGWTEKPVAAVGETAIEVADVLARMAGCLSLGVLDIDTRETIKPSRA